MFGQVLLPHPQVATGLSNSVRELGGAVVAYYSLVFDDLGVEPFDIIAHQVEYS